MTRAFCCSALLVALLAGCALTPPLPPSSPSALVGREAPRIRRPTVQGGVFDSRNLRGRVWVVEFFAAYCAPCVPRLREAEALRQQFPDVAVVGISLDESHVEALAQVRRHRLGFLVVHDTSNVLAGKFRVRELPVAIVVDAAGRIAWVGGPEHPPDSLRHAVAAIVARR